MSATGNDLSRRRTATAPIGLLDSSHQHHLAPRTWPHLARIRRFAAPSFSCQRWFVSAPRSPQAINRTHQLTISSPHQPCAASAPGVRSARRNKTRLRLWWPCLNQRPSNSILRSHATLYEDGLGFCGARFSESTAHAPRKRPPETPTARTPTSSYLSRSVLDLDTRTPLR
jgi:hypothetical protein